MSRDVSRYLIILGDILFVVLREESKWAEDGDLPVYPILSHQPAVV